MAGLMDGYLGGLKYLSGVQGMEQQKAAFGLEMQQQQQAAQANQQEKGILAQVFRENANQRTTEDVLGGQSRLAQQYRRAGQSIMGVNPKRGIELLREADMAQEKTQRSALEQVQTSLARDKYLSTVASNVADQDSLNDAVRTFAKMGRTIPAKYQVWGDDTKAWFKRQELLGTNAREQQAMEIQRRRTELEEQRQTMRERREDDRVKYESSKETRLREGLELKKRAAGAKATSELGLRGEKELNNEMTVLKDLDKQGAFKALSPGKQIEAAQDVHMRAQKIRSDSLIGGEEPVSAEEALKLAREEVLGEMVVEKGGFFSKDKAERVRGSLDYGKPTGVAPKPGDIIDESEAFKDNKQLNQVKDVAMKAWGEFDLNKYDYRIAPNGTVQRRTK